MPAIPAWPPQSTPRLFVDNRLTCGALNIAAAQAHYLVNVMRVKPGDPVKLFDDLSGEWLGIVASVGKRALVLDVTEQLRERDNVPDLWLCAAPLKKGRIDWMVEKACELGVARFMPVLTRRAVVDKPKAGRLRAHMIEAAEQCGRTALPELGDLIKLPSMLSGWPKERTLFFADETGGAPALAAMQSNRGPAAILIGPEGGFDDGERAAIRACTKAIGISLGPRILRADTAAAVAVSLWMAAVGDW